MEAEQLTLMMDGGMEIIEGRIMEIAEDGKILVKSDSGGFRIACDFLRTSAGPLPRLHLGTPVLIVARGGKGYVMGIIEPYLPLEGQETPDELYLTAEANIELSCGESLLSMTREGKIILRGKTITTRAAEQNKIRGASVRIN